MHSRNHSSAAVVLILLLFLVGCGQKSSKTAESDQSKQPTQTAQQPPTPTPTEAAKPDTPSPAEAPKPATALARPAPSPTQTAATAAAPAPVAQPVVLKTGTTVTVRLNQTINTKTAQPGQTFTAVVASPIIVNGKNVIPKGSEAQGVVVQSKSAGKIHGEGALSIALRKITVRGVTYPVEANTITASQKGKGSRTAKIGGGSAAGGALIGGIAGGGKGALIGGLVGGGAGVAGSALTGNKEVQFPVESALSFRLAQPLTLRSASTDLQPAQTAAEDERPRPPE